MERPRTPLVAGNWKMNPATREDAMALAGALEAHLVGLDGVELVICPPALWLEEIRDVIDDTRIAVGAQTMHAEERGAFTGEISPTMLAGVASHVIIGHSERRQYDGETDERVAAKVASAVRHGLVPIAAIGERSEERRGGEAEVVIVRQLRAAISRLDELAGSGLVIAYEPVWAIGTGDAATAEDAQGAAALIRQVLAERDPAGAREVRILYGGSVNAQNAATYFGQPDVDGALVGGASLDPSGFAAICRAATSAR